MPYRFLILTILLFAVVFSACQQRNDQEPYILKLGHQGNENDIWHLSSLHFAHQVDSLSKGRIKVRIFPSEQLGPERDMIRSIQSGIAEMTITGETMQNWSEITALCAIPYLIHDSTHLRAVVQGEVGEKIAQAMIKDIGLRPVAYLERGSRHLTSNRPIRTPDDLKGLILRVPNVPVFVKTWQALGAKPTPMTLSEVFTALQQGTVEAQENPFALIYSSGFFEVQRYLNLTAHVNGWIYVVIGEKKFQALPGDLQEIVIAAGKRMQLYHEKLFREKEISLMLSLKEKGMEFIDPDVATFREKAEPAVLTALSDDIRQYYYEIKDLTRADTIP